MGPHAQSPSIPSSTRAVGKLAVKGQIVNTLGSAGATVYSKQPQDEGGYVPIKPNLWKLAHGQYLLHTVICAVFLAYNTHSPFPLDGSSPCGFPVKLLQPTAISLSTAFLIYQISDILFPKWRKPYSVLCWSFSFS